MGFSIKKLFVILATEESSGRKIGLFRTICAIFGSLLVSFLFICFIALILALPLREAIVVPFLFHTFVWAVFALWISVSPSKLSALLRVIVPTTILSITIFILF